MRLSESGSQTGHDGHARCDTCSRRVPPGTFFFERMNSVKKLFAVLLTMAMAGFLTLGPVGCKKEDKTKTTTTTTEKDKDKTTKSTTETTKPAKDKTDK